MIADNDDSFCNVKCNFTNIAVKALEARNNKCEQLESENHQVKSEIEDLTAKLFEVCLPLLLPCFIIHISKFS